MKLRNIYSLLVTEGINEELRKNNQVKDVLKEKKSLYKKTKKSRKKYFDQESFLNPYSDTRILNGDPNLEVKRILVGIDIDVGELMLARELSRDGKKIDLVLSHHPEGNAWAGLYDVMHLQTDVLKNLGVNAKVAEDLMKKRIDDVERRLHSSNHQKVVDAARLLGIPLMCCHTPADNHVANYLQKLIDAQKPKTLEALVDLLLREPEYTDAAYRDVGPKIFSGAPEDKAGNVFVDMTGGTSGSKDVFPRLSQLGIKTLLGMHVSDDHYSKLKSEYINIVIAGHIASDSLGMNLILDKLLKKEKIDIVECSGFRRFSRAKKSR